MPSSADKQRQQAGAKARVPDPKARGADPKGKPPDPKGRGAPSDPKTRTPSDPKTRTPQGGKGRVPDPKSKDSNKATDSDKKRLEAEKAKRSAAQRGAKVPRTSASSGLAPSKQAASKDPLKLSGQKQNIKLTLVNKVSVWSFV